jgi:hypothetical protein
MELTRNSAPLSCRPDGPLRAGAINRTRTPSSRADPQQSLTKAPGGAGMCSTAAIPQLNRPVSQQWCAWASSGAHGPAAFMAWYKSSSPHRTVRYGLTIRQICADISLSVISAVMFRIKYAMIFTEGGRRWSVNYCSAADSVAASVVWLDDLTAG